MKALALLPLVLVLVGAVNWGLVGVAQFDLVAYLFGGQAAALSRVVYGLVGLSGVALIAMCASGVVALPTSVGSDRTLLRANR